MLAHPLTDTRRPAPTQTVASGQPRGEIGDQLKQYMDANPQAHADLEAIRQPLTDFHNRCQ